MNLRVECGLSSVAVVYNIVKEKDHTVKVKDRARERGWWEYSYRNWDDYMLENPACK